MIRLNQFVFVFAVLIIFLGCKPDEPKKSTESKDRKPMLVYWADTLIVPAYNRFKTKLDTMITRADAFAESPTQTSLADFRQAWVEAYTEWQKVAMFEFGPADKYTLHNFFNIYPADVQAIHQNIADPTVNLDLPSAYATQGFPALDYLINGVGNTDEAIVAFYTTDTEAASRIQYLKRLTARMNQLITNVIAEWSAYRNIFVSNTGLDIGSSTGLVVNAYVLHYERYIRSGKFGIPSGAMSINGTQYPEKVEAVYKKDISLTLAKAAHQAAIDFFNGKDASTGKEGPSFKSYLDALGAKDATAGSLLSDIINAQFTTINTAMSTLSENLYQDVLTNNDAMIDVFTEMQRATRMLKVDVTSAMSITITYTDNDGD